MLLHIEESHKLNKVPKFGFMRQNMFISNMLISSCSSFSFLKCLCLKLGSHLVKCDRKCLLNFM